MSSALPPHKRKPEVNGKMTVIDHRTGKTYEFMIEDNKIKASDLFSIKDKNGTGLTSK